MYRFLLTPKWLGWFVVAIIACIACVLLGNWQMHRRTDVVTDINHIEANYHQDPVPFRDAGKYFANFDPTQQWLPVKMTGTYDVDGERVVRNRPLNGRPGYQVVVPLRLDSGQTVIIDRGWLPIGNEQAGHPDEVPAPPSGEVTVVARIIPGEPKLDRGAPEGQLASIDLPTYAQQLDYPILTAAYGRLASEDPAPATTPAALPMPSTDEGPHLSYSFQWYAFGALAFVAYGYAARQTALNGTELDDEWDDEYDDDPERAGNAEGEDTLDHDDSGAEEGRRSAPTRQPVYRAAPQPRRRPVRTRRRPTAEEEEDAILDAQGFQGISALEAAGRGSGESADNPHPAAAAQASETNSR